MRAAHTANSASSTESKPASRIRQHLDLMCANQKISTAKLRRRSLLFQPMFERYCPHLLEEIRGLAEGARSRWLMRWPATFGVCPKKGEEWMHSLRDKPQRYGRTRNLSRPE